MGAPEIGGPQAFAPALARCGDSPHVGKDPLADAQVLSAASPNPPFVQLPIFGLDGHDKGRFQPSRTVGGNGLH